MNATDLQKLDYVYVLEELPELFTDHFGSYLDRAKALVDVPLYSIHLLNDVATSLSKIFEQRFGDYFLPTDNPKSLRREFSSFAELLYRNLDTVELLEYDLKDYQYFGVLALIDMTEALFFDHYMQFGEFGELRREHEVLSALCSAVEAISYGESLHPSRSPLTTKINLEITNRAKKGSDKRHAPARKIKQQFIRSYLETASGLSKRQSAKKFFRELDHDNQRKLCPTMIEENAVRSLLDELRAYEKKITPP